MAGVRVGIMGFGQTGRNVFRILASRTDLEVAAICDVVPADQLRYLLKFDTLFGRFAESVELGEGTLEFRGRPIRFWSSFAKGEVPPWREARVDVVLDCTARALDRRDAERHLEAGAGGIVVTTPSPAACDITVVRGWNDGEVRPEHRVVGIASTTVACVAPMLSILKDAFGIERVFFNAVHAYTSAHRLADVPLPDMRRGRSAPENIIPQESRSEAALEAIFPDLAGRITASAMDVPVANGSVVDLTCWHGRPVTPASIAEAVRAAGAGRWNDIVVCEEEPVVSSDVTRSGASATFDVGATLVLGERLSKTLCWIDAGWALAGRAVHAAAALAKSGSASAPSEAFGPGSRR